MSYMPEDNYQDDPGDSYFLIVDDNKMLREAYAEFANSSDILPSEVFEAKNGVEALDYISNNGLPEMIVLDLEMPKIDGEELHDKCISKYGEEYENVTVLMITGSDPNEDLPLPEERCLRKPASWTEIENKLKEGF